MPNEKGNKGKRNNTPKRAGRIQTRHNENISPFTNQRRDNCELEMERTRKNQQYFLWAMKPEATHPVTRSEYRPQRDKKIDKQINLCYLPKKLIQH